jgi:hypothetical protein
VADAPEHQGMWQGYTWSTARHGVAYDVRVTWLDLTASDSSVKVAERNSAMLHGRRFCETCDLSPIQNGCS